MNMDKEIDIYEFDWWPIFSIMLLVMVLSILLILGSTYILLLMNKRWPRFDLLCLIFLGIFSFCSSSMGLWTIQSVPKLMIFKQNSINVIFPFGKEKVFTYENISRIIIIGRITRRGQLFTKSFLPFRIRLFFIDNTIKIMFNPDRMMDFPVVMEHFLSKGLGLIIEKR